jgi:uncharacterized Fe-S cluster-containing radical SAM superfamily enzyme
VARIGKKMELFLFSLRLYTVGQFIALANENEYGKKRSWMKITNLLPKQRGKNPFVKRKRA